jgi:hypothetical protein
VTVGGDTYTIRPDGAADVSFADEDRTYRFMLEWDRGTARGFPTRVKCLTYAIYYSWVTRSNSRPPATLYVTNSLTREKTIGETFERAVTETGAPSSYFFTSQASLVEQFGPWGKVWRGAGSWDRVTLKQALTG